MFENKIIEPTIFTSNKLFIQQLLTYRYFYIILTFFFLLGAYLYNKFATTEYEVYATMAATKNETSSYLQSNDLFKGMSPIQAFYEIEDGINNLRSYSMIYTIINKLNLEIGYFSEKTGLFKTKSELYRNRPFSVTIHKSHVQPIYTMFYIEVLSDTTFRIYAKKSDAILYNYIDNEVVKEDFAVRLDTVYRFNEEINLDYLSLSVNNNDSQPIQIEEKYRYYFEMYNPGLMTKEYLKNLSIRRASSASTILYVAFRGENLEKSVFFINSYLNYFFGESLARKNTTAINTINFIDAQISGVSDSLVRSGSEITSYRSSNQVMNLSYQGQSSYDNLQRLEKERSGIKAQERYYTYILDYLRTTEDVAGIVPPSGMSVDNSVMNQLIVELLDLNSERSNIISLRGDKNPFLAETENKIKLKKQYITEIASTNLSTVKRTLNDLDYEANKLSREIVTLPRRELSMSNIQRKFDVDEGIYTYLLQKRSEATITMASNYPDFELIEPARKVTSLKAKPKSKFNYLIALILGIVIPTGTMILKNLTNFRITSTEYIQQVLNRSPIATIYSISDKTDNFIIDNPNSVSTEYFRGLRSIIFRKLSKLNSKVILVSSAQPQDGKTFLSFNLAISIAMVGKKTLIIDGDLKRPNLHKKFNLENKSGVSDFIFEYVSFEEILFKTSIKNLSFVSAGPNMLNTTEVIESGGLDHLIEAARERFEYIIIDTSPVGFMTDALLMTRFADYVLIAVRDNSTLKESFTNVLSTLDSNNITNYDVVFNDKEIKESTRYYSKYYGTKERI